MKNKAGVGWFKTKYPEIYSIFGTIITQQGNRILTFFNNLKNLHCTIYSRNSKLVSKYLRSVLQSKIYQQHPFFKLLTFYPPINVIFPPYLDEIEGALKNKNIEFEDKEYVIESLRNKNRFWSTYCELTTAYNLSLRGCRVKILKRKEKTKTPDLKVFLNNQKFNIEVSSRIYKINKKNLQDILRRKIEKEAAQLPKKSEREVNIIVIFLSSTLNFKIIPSRKARGYKIEYFSLPLSEIITPFDFEDVLYGEASKVVILPSQLKSRYRVEKRKLIFETDKNLKHIDAIGIWYYGIGIIIQPRVMLFYSKNNFPKKMREIFLSFNKIE